MDLTTRRTWLIALKRQAAHRARRRTHGPLIHNKAVAKVEHHINDAIERGAQLIHGGKRLEGSGSFFAPTILADVPLDALVCQEETFGPLAALVKFETEDEVIKLANDTSVGLAGYFYSRDIGRVWRVAEALEVGMVGTNTGAISQAVIPFGGVKESGLGTSCLARLTLIFPDTCAQVVRVATVSTSISTPSTSPLAACNCNSIFQFYHAVLFCYLAPFDLELYVAD